MTATRNVPNVTDVEAAELIALAHDLADAARKATLARFRQAGLSTENKANAGFDPVTEADRETEAAMRALIEARRPQDAILGEEFGAKSGQSGLTWVLDPIDGTRGFMTGTPSWGVLIALLNETGPIFGVIDQPYIVERVIGGLGQNYMTGPQGEMILRTSARKTLAEARLFSTFPEIGAISERLAFEAVRDQVLLTRYGMDCYAYGLGALGQADLVIEAGLQSYDIAAPIAVIEAAGGIVTNWQGGPAHQGGQVLAAANRDLHQAALVLLSEQS
ncbi:MAG: inositol monophosphatase family protein [Alphaproteobacteria bacterium]|nr:inositol monophosphatase family protein [Alphaproteobacteria bacterium]